MNMHIVRKASAKYFPDQIIDFGAMWIWRKDSSDVKTVIEAPSVCRLLILVKSVILE